MSEKSIKVDNFFKETAEIETGMAEKSSWDQANRRQEHGLVWRNRKKISQIIKDYFYLPFFLFIILWSAPRYLTTWGFFLARTAYLESAHFLFFQVEDGFLPVQIGNKTECALLGFVNHLGKKYTTVSQIKGNVRPDWISLRVIFLILTLNI